MALVVGTLVIVLVLCYFVSRGDGPGRQDSVDVEEELLHLCLGDRKQAERLLALEVKKAPGIKPAEAARRAIGSLRRDLK